MLRPLSAAILPAGLCRGRLPDIPRVRICPTLVLIAIFSGGASSSPTMETETIRSNPSPVPDFTGGRLISAPTMKSETFRFNPASVRALAAGDRKGRPYDMPVRFGGVCRGGACPRPPSSAFPEPVGKPVKDPVDQGFGLYPGDPSPTCGLVRERKINAPAGAYTAGVGFDRNICGRSKLLPYICSGMSGLAVGAELAAPVGCVLVRGWNQPQVFGSSRRRPLHAFVYVSAVAVGAAISRP